MASLQRRISDWQTRPVFLASLAAFLVLCIFLFDLLSNMGLAAGVLHILPVMMATLLPWRHATVVFAAAASLLTIASFVLLLGENPSTFSSYLGLSNRLLTLVAIWSTAILGLLWIRKDQRLQEEQARLQAVIDTSADAVVTIDKNGIVQSFSRVGERLFGYQEKEVRGRNVSMLMPSPHRERHDGYLERYRRTGEKRIIGLGRQVEAQRKDGSTFPVHLMVGEITSEGERLFTGFIHDMTERVDAERAVAEERNFIAAMLDTTQALVMVLDRHGRIIRSNDACLRLSGYRAEELVERNVLELITEGSQGLAGFLDPTAGGAAFGKWEGNLLCKDGTTRLISWSTATIGGEEDRPRYLVATGIDMTAWRLSEARARELQHHLYRIGRISELGEMASAIAHELNQPMTAVANYVNASRRLVEGLEHERARRSAELMRRAVEQTERAGQIVRRLRQLIGRGHSELQPTDLNAAVREALELALVGTREEDVEVEVTLDDDLPVILADATQLQQIVLNLVRNAVEAMQAVERRRLIVASRQTEEGGMVELSVTDSGPGLDLEVASQLFMPFVSTKPNGMGIGLSICRSIVDAHQGHIRAEAADGGGTSFRITLPAMARQVAVAGNRNE